MIVDTGAHPSYALCQGTRWGRRGITPRAGAGARAHRGNMVQHANLHNYGTHPNRDIRINDRIDIEKAGEVIPTSVGVAAGGDLKTRRRSSACMVPGMRGPRRGRVRRFRSCGEAGDETGCLPEPAMPGSGLREAGVAPPDDARWTSPGWETIEQILRRPKECHSALSRTFIGCATTATHLVAMDRMGEKKSRTCLWGSRPQSHAGWAVFAGVWEIRARR